MSSRPFLLGHRGARAVGSIRENSLESFDRALADGCDGFEFDVRLTRDHHAVLWHDPEFRELEIAQSSTNELIGLARLEEVLSRYQTTAFLDIELKVARLEKIAVELLRKFPPRRGYVVSSFLPEVIEAVNSEDAVVPLGLICETKAELSHWRRLPIDWVIPHRGLAGQDLISEIRSAGKKSMVWTVNDPADMRRFRDDGVDGIISDDPALLTRTLSTTQ